MDQQEHQHDLLSITDFFVILLQQKKIFISVWLIVMACVAAYLLLAKKTYRLSGTIYVGRFQRLLVEEGEFVAHKLRDYSFIKRALTRSNVSLDIPVSRLQRLIQTDVLNEVKKNEDVGIVQLTVDYKDQQKVYDIFKALTDQLIEEHGKLINHSIGVFKEMEAMFWENEKMIRESLARDESYAFQAGLNEAKSSQPAQTLPSHLLAQHTISEKSEFLKKLIQDIHYIRIEGESATRSFNTKLAAEPETPDEPFKPKTLLTLIIGVVLATIAALAASFLWNLYQVDIKQRLQA